MEGISKVERFLHVCTILNKLLCCFGVFCKIFTSLSVNFMLGFRSVCSTTCGFRLSDYLQLNVQHLWLAYPQQQSHVSGMTCYACTNSCDALYQKHLYVCRDNYQGKGLQQQACVCALHLHLESDPGCSLARIIPPSFAPLLHVLCLHAAWVVLSDDNLTVSLLLDY